MEQPGLRLMNDYPNIRILRLLRSIMINVVCEERQRIINEADLVFLCLPDDAAGNLLP